VYFIYILYAFRNVYLVKEIGGSAKPLHVYVTSFRYKLVFFWYENPVHDIALVGSKVLT